MAFVAASIKQRVREIKAGQNGYREVTGIAAFSTTDASGDVDCLISKLEGYSIHPIGAVATDESIYLDEASSVTSGDGYMKRPSDGKLTFTRTGAAKTSGLIVAFRYWGI